MFPSSRATYRPGNRKSAAGCSRIRMTRRMHVLVLNGPVMDFVRPVFWTAELVLGVPE